MPRKGLPKLFIAVCPTGLSYSDSANEEGGDFIKVAFLPYDTLELKVRKPGHALLPEILEDVAAMQARRGEEMGFSSCGSQTVILGGARHA